MVSTSSVVDPFMFTALFYPVRWSYASCVFGY